MNTLQAEFEHLAEIEWMEHYYGLDQRSDERSEMYANETYGLDDPMEYQGYRGDEEDFTNTDWPAFCNFVYCDMSQIPF